MNSWSCPPSVREQPSVVYLRHVEGFHISVVPGIYIRRSEFSAMSALLPKADMCGALADVR